ncbi:Transposable element tcb1 transposase [Caligus rogercresseyi]|uniref:Transposable element tcb1 transposase n=1 Tax=Caligus rogercresseyi TaxID=217165 RepID=A0A7T8HGN4_CALRO|nr:Transposable element tcb1 transposase [Caligus rogercresseyi]
MSSELERRTAIMWRSVRPCAQGDHRLLQIPHATVYSIAKSFKESEDIEEGFLIPERKTPDRFGANWCLENLDMFWSKEFWPPIIPDLTPATTTCGASLRGTLISVLTTLWTP